MNNSINRLLNAKSIAIVGANERDGYSGRFLRNLINNEYEGRIYPINPKYEKVLSLKCYSSISEINDKIDLAVIIVPVSMVIPVVEECEKNHVGSVLIITAGFSEQDAERGYEREKRLNEIATRSGMRIAGPNCLGIANVRTRMWACSLATLGVSKLKDGRAALISHSGATGFGPLLTQAEDRGIGFRYIITTGNEVDLSISDFIETMLNDDEIDVIAVLIEGIKDGQHFLRITEQAKKMKKPIIVLKIGESEIGERAAANHTSSMTGDNDIFSALLKQRGVIRADDFDEFVELVKFFQKKKKLKGNRFAVISHSGGIAGIMGDKLGKYGLKVPILAKKTQDLINSYLNGFGSPENPLDLTGHLRSDNLYKIIDAIEENEDIDAYVFATHGDEKTVNRIIDVDGRVDKPVLVVWTGSVYAEGLRVLKDSTIPVFLLPDKAAKCLSAILKHLAKVEELQDTKESNNLEIDFDQFTSGVLNEVQSKSFLKMVGIEVPKNQVIYNEIDLKNLEMVDGGRHVLKVVSNGIIHKSDVGGVILNLNTKEEVTHAFEKLSRLKSNNPSITGFLLEEMIPEGLDLIVGVNRDPQYGLVLTFGYGGIYAELFKQISWKIFPYSNYDIRDLLQEIPGLIKIINGYRNQETYEIERIIDVLNTLSQISNYEEVESIEINPLRLLPKSGGLIALDCILEIKKTK